VLFVCPPYVVAQQSHGGATPDVAILKKQFRSAVLPLFHPEGGEVQTGPAKRRHKLYPGLVGKPVRLVCLGFNRSSPIGPPYVPSFLTDPKGRPGIPPHQAMSCLVHVIPNFIGHSRMPVWFARQTR
jgi:hypothetical protein